MSIRYYKYTDRDGDRIEVYTWGPGDPAIVRATDHGGEMAEVAVPADDAPALALTILEAAGYTTQPETPLSSIVYNLRGFIEVNAKRKAEAEEAKKLDEEAKAFEHAAYAGNGITPPDWHAVARKAREIHGGAK